MTDSPACPEGDAGAAIHFLEERLSMNTVNADMAADRLEIELRIASELPGPDVNAFAAAQRRRLGALTHERERIVAELTSLRQRLSGTVLPA